MAEEWVKLAKDAGAGYMVLTTRHHEGFSLFKSRHSAFNSGETCQRDMVAEYVSACRKYGMRVGLYYSLLDWRWSAYHRGPRRNPQGWQVFLQYVHGQVRELVSNYGKIDILWYDGSWPYDAQAWQARKLNAMVRRYQPDILINDRSGTPEDFDTHSEQKIETKNRPWECVMPLSDFWWGYIPGDRHPKDTYQVIRNLVLCASHGGNFMINIGPAADGTIPASDRSTLLGVGQWLQENGESIYGTQGAISNKIPTPLATPWGGTTKRKNRLYLHLLYWGRQFSVPDVPFRVRQAFFLKTGKPVTFSQEGS
ncbi:MAG: alpha-L-fucosidase, partial [Candidatus Omnitrophica bacterium]|nr:alpha-L-fucosidase [Candidatus Omnitrophota bacterium]